MGTTTIRPLEDWVVVELERGPGKSAGGILLPDVARRKSEQGTVVALGPGRPRDDGTLSRMVLVTGDRVLFGQYSGHDLERDGKEYRVLRHSDILGVLTG